MRGPWQPGVDREEYRRAIDRIRDYIAAGDTYQVNYTFPLRAGFAGDPWPLFERLCRAQRAQYSAYLEAEGFCICSASPELFFELDGERIVARPMKGTSPRGRTLEEDLALRAALRASIKNRAENAMIVDMMRNDLGRIARRRSVEVLSAFDVEPYPTVLQMTSTVAARTDASLPDIFRALFPAASITGAPKIRTMQIIRELEPFPRGVYTGCIGYIGPGRQARFSVAIRTLVVDQARRQAEYSVGSGIVWDSRPDEEYAECLTKARVLPGEEMGTVPVSSPAVCPDEFELLETMFYDGREFFLLEGHLRRLRDSAEFFDFALDLAAVRARLAAVAEFFGPELWRIRLLVARDGQIDVQGRRWNPAPDEPWRLRLAARPVDSGNLFLYHKTTFRRVYEEAGPRPSDGDDVVLFNERGEVTETTIANLVLELDGRLLTPPAACGLLPGVFRAHLLATGQVQEQAVRLEQLRQASRLFAVNSVRKWMPAVLLADS